MLENDTAQNIFSQVEEICTEKTTESTELSLSEKITILENDLIRSQDDYLRLQAEMQNQMKRSQEEIKKSRDYAISGFAKELIAVKDYLEMALKDESGCITTIKTGVELTLKQLSQVFENHKIKIIDVQAKDKLDPHLHQAMSTTDEHQQDSNTIVSIMQKGYTLNDRVIRPAMVVIAKEKVKEQEKDNT